MKQKFHLLAFEAFQVTQIIFTCWTMLLPGVAHEPDVWVNKREILLRLFIMHPQAFVTFVLLHLVACYSSQGKRQFAVLSLNRVLASATVTTDGSPVNVVATIGRVTCPGVDLSLLSKVLQFQVRAVA